MKYNKNIQLSVSGENILKPPKIKVVGIYLLFTFYLM